MKYLYNDLVTQGNEILIRWNELVILRVRISYFWGTNKLFGGNE